MEKKKEPFVRMVKRESLPLGKSILFRVIAIVMALVVCSIFIVVCTKCNPIQVYSSVWKGVFGSTRKMWNTARDTAILLCIAIAIAPAFRMKFWNIGAEGQALIGALVTLALMRNVADKVPAPTLFLAMIVLSMAAAAVWGAIPAIFKALWNTNETLFTLMMNYIAIQLVAFFCIKWEAMKGTGTISVVNQDSMIGWLPTKFMSAVFGNYNFVLIVGIVFLATFYVYMYMKYSKHGYELAVVGESINTARYAGINVKYTIIRTMAFSGALCGLAGFLIVSGCSHTIETGTIGGQGFTAIIVAWLAKLNPFVMILISFLLVFMDAGAKQIASDFTGFNEAASDIMIGMILFFILAAEFFTRYRLIFRTKSSKEVDA